jgi:hypothetical protein
MSINQAALEKVREAKMSGGGFVNVLEVLAASLAFTGAVETNMTFDYQHDEVDVEPGDLIPFITIGLRQATIKHPIVEVTPEMTSEEPSSDLPG